MYRDITAVGGGMQDVRNQRLAIVTLLAICFLSLGLDVFSLRCD